MVISILLLTTIVTGLEVMEAQLISNLLMISYNSDLQMNLGLMVVLMDDFQQVVAFCSFSYGFQSFTILLTSLLDYYYLKKAN